MYALSSGRADFLALGGTIPRQTVTVFHATGSVSIDVDPMETAESLTARVEELLELEENEASLRAQLEDLERKKEAVMGPPVKKARLS